MQEQLPIFSTNEVFVAGKQPTITYNPRDDRHLEQEVRGYVDQLGKALSVSGPTKSGKTVLIERLLPPDRAIWIQGSEERHAADDELVWISHTGLRVDQSNVMSRVCVISSACSTASIAASVSGRNPSRAVIAAKRVSPKRL